MSEATLYRLNPYPKTWARACRCCTLIRKQVFFFQKRVLLSFWRGRNLPRRVSKIWDHICETELKVGSQMRFHIFRTRIGTDWTFRCKDHEIEVLGPRFRETDFCFGLFRCASAKSETTFVNQLSILFHKSVLRFQFCFVVWAIPP